LELQPIAHARDISRNRAVTEGNNQFTSLPEFTGKVHVLGIAARSLDQCHVNTVRKLFDVCDRAIDQVDQTEDIHDPFIQIQ
jgi:hypothetical protein